MVHPIVRSWVRSECSGLPCRPLELVVVHDDVGQIGRADRSEVELLGGDVAVAPAPRDVGGGQHPLLSDHGAINGLRERGRHEDAQVPPINQFRAQEEYAVEEQHGVCGGGRNRRAQRSVRPPVVDRLLEPSVSARTERIEQNPVQRVVVVGIEIAAFGRVLAAR